MMLMKCDNPTHSQSRKPSDLSSHKGDSLFRAAAKIQVTNNVKVGDIERLLPKAASVIGTLAPAEAIVRVAATNADAIWLYARTGEQPEGFQAALLLTEEGRRALFHGKLDLRDPPNHYLVRQDQSPAAIYIWASFTPGILAAGLPRVLDHFSSPRYAGADLVASAATQRGERALARYGFQPSTYLGMERPDLYVLSRAPRRSAATAPLYDSYDPLSRTGIAVVHNAEDLMKVAAIRSAVYIGEQACPFAEEFDGNDFAATHLLGYVGGEPAGCMRVRFFADFAKLERLAVLRPYRRSRLAFDLVRASVELCRAKGYRRLYGHARTDLLAFWKRFGFRQHGTDPFRFSGIEFVEMTGDIVTTNDAVSIEDGPYRVIRPEGQWHRRGVLEDSASR